MIKRIIFGIICASLVLGLCACSGEQSNYNQNYVNERLSGLDSQYECTINVCGNWGNFEALDAAALLFKEYFPNIEIVYNQLSDFQNDLANRMVSGEELDIYMYDGFLSNDTQYETLWSRAQDLTGVLDMSSINANYLATGVVNGKQTAVPIYRNCYGFVVNEDLLKQNGLEIPTTIDEFIDCCKYFKSQYFSPVLVPNTEFFSGGAFSALAAYIMKQDNRKDIIDNLYECKDTDKIILDTIISINRFYYWGFVHPNSDRLDNDYDAAILRFFEGDIPFMAFHLNYFSGTKKREARSETFTMNPFEYSFISFPGVEGTEVVYEQLGTMYLSVYDGVPSEKLPYVDAFMQFLLDDAGNTELASVKNLATSNEKNGAVQFPHLQEISNDHIFYLGMNEQGDELLRLNYILEVMKECYLPSINSSNFLAQCKVKLESDS